MPLRGFLLAAASALVAACRASPPEAPAAPKLHVAQVRRSLLSDELEAETLTRQWWGAGPKLAEKGITATLDLYAICQTSVTGGVETGPESEGQYQLALDFDLDRLLGIRGGSVFARVDGGWDGGINQDVGGVLAPNGLFAQDVPIYVSRLWYEQDLLDTRLRIRAGKQNLTDGIDFHGQTVGFDGNAYANGATTQFLNASLGNDPAIPFPAEGLAAQLLGEPVERFYVTAALSNANAKSTTSGFSQAFGPKAQWMVMAEAGYVTSLGAARLPGLLCVGSWDTDETGFGVYFDMNQLVWRERSEGPQGLGVFARYGYASDLPPVQAFASVGAQYRGLLPRRDDDVLGLGWSQAFLDGQPASYEGVLEAYYRAKVTTWFFLSPMVQFLVNPTLAEGDDAVVLALRGQIVF